VVDRLAGVERPHAGADLRGGRKRRATERAPVGGQHFHGVAGAGVAFQPRHRAGENPRMPAQQRAFLAGM